MPSKIPIVIISYNQLYFLENFIRQIRHLTENIIIMDNHSDYPPLIDFLEKAAKDPQITVIRLEKNYGHNVCAARADLLPWDHYVVSDPDLLLNDAMPSDALDYLLEVSQKYGMPRVGLALERISPDKFISKEYGNIVNSVEGQYYINKVEENIYKAYIDTTFCIVNRAFGGDQHLRIAGEYTAKHLPWYDGFLRDNIPQDELRYWIENNISSSILKFIDPKSLLLNR